MTTHHIRRGFDIKIAGQADAVIEDAPEPVVVALMPRDFPGIKPKLLVKEGEEVRTGQPVYFDKARPTLRFASPVTGRVAKIELGARRFVERVEITPSSEEAFFDGARLDPEGIDSVERIKVVEALEEAGLWPMLRQRPVGRIADREAGPSAIYVNCMDTEPLAADPAFAVRGRWGELQRGIDVLRRLSDGPVRLTVRPGAVSAELKELRGVEIHEFDGPHPAGLVGTHIAEIAPLKAAEVVWYLKATEAVAIGEWLATGQYPTHRVVAVAGTGAPKAAYYRVRNGAALLTLTGGKPLEGDWRVINGTVLSGTAAEPTGFLGYYTHTVSIIPAGTDRREMFGWATPQFGRHSASRSVLGWLMPKAKYDLDARMNGGPRNIVNIGQWEAMTPLDIHPTYLVRAIQAGDLEEAINLGLLEVTEEDVALCTYADPCKIEVGQIIRQGLEMFEKEG